MYQKNIKKIANEMIRLAQGLKVMPTGELVKERPPKDKTVGHKGFNISVYKSPKWGLYWAQNDIGEPYMEVPLFNTSTEAVKWDKENIDKYVNENK